MNDTYKGIITKPINEKITVSYGIKFPTQAFWNSFIATRDEYRKFFVTLPKIQPTLQYICQNQTL